MRADLTYKGAATNVCANTTAAVVNGKLMPKILSAEPNNPLRPNAINKASPATEGGSTIGKSMNNSIHDLNLKRQRANIYASGVPRMTVPAVVIVLVTKLRRRALNACSENALLKKSLLTERTNSANNGSANKANNIPPGIMKIQLK